MTALQELALCGIRVSVEGESLRLTGLDNPTPRTLALVEEVKQNKQKIIFLLRQQAQGLMVITHDPVTTENLTLEEALSFKLVEDAGQIHVIGVIYHKKTALIDVQWQPITPPAFITGLPGVG